jgi:hypothetical protein
MTINSLQKYDDRLYTIPGNEVVLGALLKSGSVTNELTGPLPFDDKTCFCGALNNNVPQHHRLCEKKERM